MMPENPRRHLFVFLAGAALSCSPPDEGRTDGALKTEIHVSAQGRLEGASETVEVAIDRYARVANVLAEESVQVRAGEPLLTLYCDREAAGLVATRARSRRERARKKLLLTGERAEAVSAAAAETTAARARQVRAEEILERRSLLWEDERIIPRDDLNEAERFLEVAIAERESALWRERLAAAEPRDEELELAEASIAAAEGEVQRAQAELDRCTVRAPIAGTILRRLIEPGEATAPGIPLFRLVDTTKWRVRAEFDERFFSQVRLGQEALVGIPGVDGRVSGTVSEIGQEMGRKTIRSGDPSEKSDRDVLEVLIDLDVPPEPRAVGLRVIVVLAP